MQFGDGNFLRAFTAWMIDLLNERTSFNGGITVVAPLRNKTELNEEVQDNLYHVVLQGIQNGAPYSELRLITSVEERVNPYSHFRKYLSAGENPELKFIFSNTTESGITFNERDQDATQVAESFPGKLTQLLLHRFNHFKGDPEKGLIIIPCELIENNGKELRRLVPEYASLWKVAGDFIEWIRDHNVFCDSLVDRIVTGFPTDHANEIQQQTGYADEKIVAAEPYYLWVIEGPQHVSRELPATEAGLNVKFTTDLTPYRTTKVRILNGAHTAMTLYGYLRGYRTVRDCMESEEMMSYVKNFLNEEVIPTLPLPVEELRQYSDAVLERFLNPFIKHQLASIALNSVSKFKVRILPTLIAYHELKAAFPTHILKAFATLIVFYRGEWKGEILPVNDSAEVKAFFKTTWLIKDSGRRIADILSNTSLWGTDLNKIHGLANALDQQVQSLLSEE
jgi:tagaturonate reductase